MPGKSGKAGFGVRVGTGSGGQKPPAGFRGQSVVVVWGQCLQKPDKHAYLVRRLRLTNAFSRRYRTLIK